MHRLELLFEPRRLALLRSIWRSERTAGELVSGSGVTFGAVSQHLKKLLDAGAVTVRRDGRRRFYRADREALGAIAPLLEAMWAERLTELKSLAEAEQKHIDRKAVKRTSRRKKKEPRK